MEYSYIATLGLSPNAVINSLLASIDENVHPDKITLVGSEQSIKTSLGPIRTALKDMSPPANREFRIATAMVPEEDVLKIMNTIKKIIREEKKRNKRVCIDITGGRKTMSAAALAAAYFFGASFVHYFWLKSPENEKKAYHELKKHQDYELIKIPVVEIPHLDEMRDMLKKIGEGAPRNRFEAEKALVEKMGYHGYIKIEKDAISVTETGKALLTLLE